MPNSFEQQRELITTFRSVARSLLASPEEPVTMRDLDGNLLRSRVRNVIARLVELGFVKETKERPGDGRYAQMFWRLVDEPARALLERVVDDRVQTSKLLWPNEETEPEPSAEEPAPIPEVGELAAPEDPVALVAAILEGFNERIVSMEKRTEAVDGKLDKVAGGMSELIAVVSKVAAREQPKPYDDTELLLGVTEQNELLKALLAQSESHKELLEKHVFAAAGLIKVVEQVREAIAGVEYMMKTLAEEGVKADNPTMTKGFAKMSEQFKQWQPVMQECLTGLQIVNKNHLATSEEVNGMFMTILQAVGAAAKGENFNFKAKPVTHQSLRKSRSHLPSLSAMMASKDLEKQDGLGALTVTLPSSLASVMEEVAVLEEDLEKKNTKLSALKTEMEAEVKKGG